MSGKFDARSSGKSLKKRAGLNRARCCVFVFDAKYFCRRCGPPVGNGALRSKTPMVVEPEKSAFEQAPPKQVLAINPTAEIGSEPAENLPEKV
jgi:hypothetical protein